MFTIWADLGLLLGAAILAGLLWFVLYILGKYIFEDMLGGTVSKVRRKRVEEKDHYIY
jgi:hypothetical protein